MYGDTAYRVLQTVHGTAYVNPAAVACVISPRGGGMCKVHLLNGQVLEADCSARMLAGSLTGPMTPFAYISGGRANNGF